MREEEETLVKMVNSISNRSPGEGFRIFIAKYLDHVRRFESHNDPFPVPRFTEYGQLGTHMICMISPLVFPRSEMEGDGK